MRSAAEHRHRWLTPLKVTTGTALSVLTAITVTGCGNDEPRVVFNDFQVFSESPRDDDTENRERFRNMHTALDENTLRRVGSDDDFQFYAALAHTDADDDESEKLCFIIGYDPDQASSVTCADTVGMDAPVVWLSLGFAGQSVQAYLVPDQQPLDLPQGWRQISPNIVVIDDSEDTADTATVMVDNAEFELQRGGGPS